MLWEENQDNWKRQQAVKRKKFFDFLEAKRKPKYVFRSVLLYFRQDDKKKSSPRRIVEIIIFNKKNILYCNQGVKKIDYLKVRITSNFPSVTLTAKRKPSNVSMF